MTQSTCYLPDNDATVAMGQLLALVTSDGVSDPAHRRCLGGRLFLRGDLGAGKTTLTRGLLRGYGHAGAVKSPTYTLVERYPITGGEAAHLDLYRLASAAELDFLGLDELAADATLWLVEWPERGKGVLPPADLRIQLSVHGAGRRARLVSGTASGEAWLGRLDEARAGPG